ncbi:hypothetical protein [Streptomyces purpurogeneiscleroticus]|uniref:hypothetical protein n=1 Tax=Streptomyces purpurogeneiscleroticus TaxID=68259 RepID=UPI001CC1BE56|nr:hypothetical protein [Streptomyces purpurogeneiscleroticus]MBZ4014458.1 hypothetical protein [Streptomyces purpurogeneiscleroticus]
MSSKQIVVITVTVIVSVFAWGAAMVAFGQVAATVALAPVLGVTAQQIIRAVRAPAPGQRTASAADQEEDTP